MEGTLFECKSTSSKRILDSIDLPSHKIATKNLKTDAQQRSSIYKGNTFPRLSRYCAYSLTHEFIVSVVDDRNHEHHEESLHLLVFRRLLRIGSFLSNYSYYY